jgi:predicted outer membrane repeat protein
VSWAVPSFVLSSQYKSVMSSTPGIINVHSLIDGPANISSCSTSPSGLPSCNLRSAWALCLHLISGLLSCPSPHSSCEVVLPSGSTSTLELQYGGSLTFSGNSSGCDVTLSITSSSQSIQATIRGDGSQTGLLSIKSYNSTLISLRLVGLRIINFNTAVNAPVSLILLGLNMVTFDHVTLLSNGALTALSPLLEIDQTNSVIFNNLLAEHNLCSIISISQTIEVIFTRCVFNNNMLSLQDNLLQIYSATNLVMTDTTVSNTSIGQILYFKGIESIDVTRCNFTNNHGQREGVVFTKVTESAITDSTFSKNTYDRTGYVLDFYMVLRSVITRSSFTENAALHSPLLIGCDVTHQYNCTASFTNSTFVRNSGHYGSVYLQYTISSFRGCTFHLNNATYYGIISTYYCTVTVDDCSFSSNSALLYGGAIYLYFGINSSISRSTFTNNSAVTGSGGAMLAYAVTNFSIVDCHFSHNYAGVNGGCIDIGGQSFGITVDRSILSRNTAQVHGGGIYFSTSIVNINIARSNFSGNAALEGSGGAVYFKATCSKISIGGLRPLALSFATASYAGKLYDSSSYNTGFVDMPEVSGYYITLEKATPGIYIFDRGGLVYSGDSYINAGPGIGGNSPFYVSGHFLKYTIYESASRFFFTAYPVLTEGHNTVFSGNKASLSGGAVYFGDSNTEVLVMPETLFTGNVARGKRSSGGAVFMEISNSVIHILNSTFVDNSAVMGGAISLSQSNYPMSLYHCKFSRNSAVLSGGAVYLGDGNGFGFFQVLTIKAIRFLDAVFINNTAGNTGGGAFFSSSNAVSFNSTILTGNSAGHRGGALHFDSKNVVEMKDCTLSYNAAVSGGAMSIFSASSVNFYGLTSFRSNHASRHGGAVFMGEGSASFLLGETSFIGNNATVSGGAILSSASVLTLGVRPILFKGNAAGQGSVFRLIDLSLIRISPSNTSITFQENRCSGRGGTVSWIKEPNSSYGDFTGDAILNFKRIVYLSNSARFGNISSTQATRLQFVGNTSVAKYHSVLIPQPTVRLLDYFSNKDITDSESLVTATVEKSNCSGRQGYLLGDTTGVTSGGDAQFSNLAAICFPGGNMILKYTGKRRHLMQI